MSSNTLSSHLTMQKGPIQVYIAAKPTNGEGPAWTKLASQGYDPVKKTWAVDDLIANKGKHSVTLPADLAPNDYLLRAEIIALHEADTNYSVAKTRGAQFYPSCSQVTVKGAAGSRVKRDSKLPGNVAVPSQKFNFVGGYKYTDPGILFNLYAPFTSYTAPGPAVWTGTTSTQSSGSDSGYSVPSSAPVSPASGATTQQPGKTVRSRRHKMAYSSYLQ
jgi:lytic cellulose monooxygenase (C1-hydroxylating)